MKMRTKKIEEFCITAIKALHERAKTIDGINAGFCRCHTSDVNEKFKVGEVFTFHCAKAGGKDFSDMYSVFEENSLRLINFDRSEDFHGIFEEITKQQYEQVLTEQRFDL